MDVAVVHTRGLDGLDAPAVRVEAHMGNGLPAFNVVGLAETEVKEARDRVRAALQTCGFEFPQRRITVNLSPADLPKASGRFDLPIAVGILAASGQAPARLLPAFEFAGELALSGELRPVRGALAMTFGAHRDGRALVVPASVAAEASLARAARVYPARNLGEVFGHLSGQAPLQRCEARQVGALPHFPDLQDVLGQAKARRALEIAAAGGHSLLFCGPPGTGKTMLAQRLPGILPPMGEAESLEVAAIQSVSGQGFRAETYGVRPFRAPHHTASAIALVGGGSPPRPGEISLAHHGVLFLDELPEYDRRVLEVLREPLESGRITISRAARQADFPAAFQLVAAMNPCPCGFFGHHAVECRCKPGHVARYRDRLSGPLLDRIDMHVEVPSLSDAELAGAGRGEPSPAVRGRVHQARQRQLERQGVPNARLSDAQLDRHAHPDAQGVALLRASSQKAPLSARAHQRLLKVARTIADLAGAAHVGRDHLAEAISYRHVPRL